MGILSIDFVAFTILSYPVSAVELVATLFGLASVYLATRPSIYTWPTGIVNVIGFSILFYQYQLYSDMLLQGYFLVVTLYGWYYWSASNDQRPIERLSKSGYLKVFCILLPCTVVLGSIGLNIHALLPTFFDKPASFPFLDAFTTVASIIAMMLLARKVWESWVLWILVDIISIYIYSQKSIILVAIEYGIFLALASYGLIHWWRKVCEQEREWRRGRGSE